MSKATFVYLFTILLFAAGLWAILNFGSLLLRAPEDLSGVWELEPSSQIAETEGRYAGPLTVVQSGRFFNLSFATGQTLDLKLREEKPDADDGQWRWVLGNERWTLTAQGRPESDKLALQLKGPSQHAWEARRIIHRYPRPDVEAAPQAQPAVHDAR